MGNLAVCEETVGNRFKFNGRQYDPVTQQYYLCARYYNSVIGRFTQEDTYRGDGLNLYAYCANNPVIYYDPSGHGLCPKTLTQPGNDGSVEGGSKTGADRAAQYSGSWQSCSVKDAINRFAPDATPTYTDSGKIIFRNETTGIEVVYDRNGNYYRIIDTSLLGRRTALDIDGNIVPNNVQTERGAMRGMKQSEYNAITHFNNTDLDFDN